MRLWEHLTVPSHPAVVLSAHGFCGHVCKARKDGLPAHRLTKPFVFCWTVCCIVKGAWLKGDCQSPLIYLFYPSCRVKEAQLQNTVPRGFFFLLISILTIKNEAGCLCPVTPCGVSMSELRLWDKSR